MATGPRSSPRLASWREPSIPLRNYLEGFVTLSALVAVNAAGNGRHAAADAPTQVRMNRREALQKDAPLHRRSAKTEMLRGTRGGQMGQRTGGSWFP